GRFLDIVCRYARHAEILKLDPRRVNDQIRELYREHQEENVIIVSSGDPLFSGIAKNVLIQNIPCRVVPGISSIQVACARVLTSWDNMAFLTLHEEHHRRFYNAFVSNVERMRAKFCMLTTPQHDPATVIRDLVGRLRGYVYYVCENLTLPGERVVRIERDVPEDLHWNSVIVAVPRERDLQDLLYRPLLS
ncbi:MAG: hypothetical protein GXO23_05950, partial [Crenarchaeota archaeon]|nr:hypothetical protein [Thermoproteota archaeon]